MKKLFLFLLISAMAVSQMITASPDLSGWNERPTDTSCTTLSNLVIFVRFADDEEITYPFNSLDSMFNCRTATYPSVYNYFNISTYGKIHYNTVYANQVQGNSIVSFVDEHPRGYYQPYSDSNPIGYHGANPFIGISMREAQLLAAAMDYVDSLGLVDSDINLDGNNDGMIDNISFIIKGNVGNWAEILWPHMEKFPQDSIDHLVQINGKLPYTFNFEFEGAGSTYFNMNVFRHEMMHSLGIPDLYNYTNHTAIQPVYFWDVMGNNYVMNQTNMMHKSQYLHVADDPIQITEDGTYTLYSNATHTSQSSYIIKSAIDSTQWFTFEYRNKDDLFDEGIPGTGLIIGRWNTNVPLNMYANMFFDNDTVPHQYWIFRPGSNSDIENGDIFSAHFSAATGRTSFGPTTNPYPFLSDGTAENSFEITDIQEQGEFLTFHVHFFYSGIDDQILTGGVSAFPNPADNYLTFTGKDMQRIEIYNSTGQLVLSETTADSSRCTIAVDRLSAGLHIARIFGQEGKCSIVKFIKR